MNRKALFHLSIFTLLGFPLIAYIILHFIPNTDFWDILSLSHLTVNVLLIGLGFGLVSALLGLFLIKFLPKGKLNDMLGGIMQQLNPQWHHIIFYSFCAGFGEEILFRGALQIILYLWPTAILFVAIHGYINLKDKSMFMYGVFLVFISAGFGYLQNYLGIYAAIMAHFIYDIVIFAYMKKYHK